MRILITGTAGFIGYHLAKLLCKDEHEVLGLDQINSYYDINLKFARLRESGILQKDIIPQKFNQSITIKNYNFIQADLEDQNEIFRIFSIFRPEIVINLAAQAGVRYSLTNPDVYITSNVMGFLNVLEACRKFPVSHLLYASSSSVYGLNKATPFSVHSAANHPVSLYAASKKANEMMSHTYSHLFGIPTTGLRFFTVYGPWGRPDMALFVFTKSILNNEPIEVFNDGNMERDFTYIDDVVKGISLMIDNPPSPGLTWDPVNPDPSYSSAPFRIYNIGNNKPIRLLDFISEIEKCIQKKAIMVMKPLQPGDVEKTWADVDDLVRDFDFRPDTPVEFGVKIFIEWYTRYYNTNH